jgi:hypothetical protein
VLERGKLSECLETFISETATGAKRPAPIAYEAMPTSDSDGLGKASQMPQGRELTNLSKNSRYILDFKYQDLTQ